MNASVTGQPHIAQLLFAVVYFSLSYGESHVVLFRNRDCFKYDRVPHRVSSTTSALLTPKDPNNSSSLREIRISSFRRRRNASLIVLCDRASFISSVELKLSWNGRNDFAIFIS